MRKIITGLLVGSIAMSVVLIGILFAGYRGAGNATPPPVVARAAPAPAKPTIDATTWNNLRSGDLPAMVQRLREQGVPPEFLRAIMMAQLAELFAPRLKAVDPDFDRRPFWKNYSIDPKVQMAQRQLYREQQKLMRELLGPDAEPAENLNAVFQQVRFESVPAEKVSDVKRILRDFEDARADIFTSSAGGMIGPEFQKKLEALQKDQQAALAGVLTPQELEEWNVRNSDTARSLRYQLSAFNPTEQEYRTVYRLQAEFNERFPPQYGPLPSEEQQRRGEAQRQVTEQIKAALGPARAEEYERSNDYSYRQTTQLVARLELPPTTTDEIYKIQKDIRDKMSAVTRANPTSVEREQQFAQLAAETEKRVTALLGARGFDAYKQYGGSWMQALRSKPANAPAVPVPAR